MIKVLVVDNVPDVGTMLSGILTDAGHQAQAVQSANEALQALTENPYHVAIIDMRLEEEDKSDESGLKLTGKVRDRFPNVKVIILTGYATVEQALKATREYGAVDYVDKRILTSQEGIHEFLAKLDKDKLSLPQVLESLISSARPPFPPPRDVCTFTLSLKPKQCIRVRASGLIAFTYNSTNPLNVESAVYSRHADNIQAYDWRFKSKEIGKQLYRMIFEEHKEVLGGYHNVRGRMLGRMLKEYFLHLCFESSKDFLRVPLEFAFDSNLGEYLALKHPLSRFVEGVDAGGRLPLSTEFLNELWDRREALKVLLIASNTKPRIDGVDEEIRALALFLRKAKEGVGVLCQLKHIPTEQATYERVTEELLECKYHIVHYAGHGHYDEQSPERSSLFFWEKENRQGDVRPMMASTLKLLLENSDVRFIYLSCCSGSMTGDSAQLLDDDFLGIADGVVHAGVPAVLGFRWPVSDKSAKQLALAFYESLLSQGNLGLALLHARREVAILNRDDPTWISPILIVQS